MDIHVEHNGEIVIVHLSGRIDFESADRFKESCLAQLTDKKVIFNLKKLNFVGSSGITPLIETITKLSSNNNGKFKVCNASVEFKRVFENSEINSLEIYEDTQTATYSFDYTPTNLEAQKETSGIDIPEAFNLDFLDKNKAN